MLNNDINEEYRETVILVKNQAVKLLKEYLREKYSTKSEQDLQLQIHQMINGQLDVRIAFTSCDWFKEQAWMYLLKQMYVEEVTQMSK